MGNPKKSHVAHLHEKLRKKSKRTSYVKTVEEDFINSWNWVESLYKPHPLCEKILPFMKTIREKGYEKTLRAGQSLWTFMISRSIRHGLQAEQRYIYIHFTEEGMIFGFNDKKKQEITTAEIKYIPELEKMLQELQKTIIT